MITLEPLIAVFAPHHCLSCGKEGALLCTECSASLPPHPSICYRCHRLSPHFRTCATCRRYAPLHSVTIATLYEEPLRSVLHRLKFERARAAAGTLGQLITQDIQDTAAEIVVPVPSASRRQRQRGYNPAHEIAASVARELHLPLAPVLGRLGQKRQVGARRRERLRQLTGAFYVFRAQAVSGKRVLLVDDILTTGATLAECAKVLRAAGAKRIEAAVVARHHVGTRP